MKVPLLDLTLQYQSIKKEIDSALNRVVQSQKFILGSEVADFEKSLAQYLQCPFGIGVSSGTDALLVALMAIDLKPGDEVIIPTYSFFATAGVVSRLQAVPVFCDIDPLTFNISPQEIERKIGKKTRAIIPVHLFGQSADMAPIMAIAEPNQLAVIEDAAQAIGSQYQDGRRVGTIGRIGCFSFFPSKNLGCYGDGGFLVTPDEALAEKIRLLRVHGAGQKYFHRIIGGNFRLDALQAAVLQAKLLHLDSWSKKRRQNAETYCSLFKAAGLAEKEGGQTFAPKNRVLLPAAVYKPQFPEKSNSQNLFHYHIYNQFVIRVESRNELQQFLKEREIGTEVYYPVPFHRQECFADLNSRDSDFPVANRSAEQSLALPIFPELTKEQIAFVVESIADFFGRPSK